MSVVRESKSVTKKAPFFKYCLSIGMKRIKLESLKRMLRCIVRQFFLRQESVTYELSQDGIRLRRVGYCFSRG